MRRLPDTLLRAHHCLVTIEDERGKRQKELAYQQYLRLGQSLWRSEQGLPAGGFPSAPQGAWIPAERSAANFLSDAAWESAQAMIADGEKYVDKVRLLTNLLSSQPLCCNLFGPLAVDLDLASRVLSRLFGEAVRVTQVELEYSPGRGDARFTGDRSAADAFIVYERGGKRGCVAIEVKYCEDLEQGREAQLRNRYSKIATAAGCFREGSEAMLAGLPLQQLWRDHLLVLSMLQDADLGFDEGRFVLLCPTLNESCSEVADSYRRQLTATETFQTWTLEAFVDAVKAECAEDWPPAFEDRYLAHQRVDEAWQDHTLRSMTESAKQVAAKLGSLREQHSASVQFRPTAGGVTMVSLSPARPQLGRNFKTVKALLQGFDAELRRWTEGAEPGRPTPEKELQSFLVSDAQCHGGRMAALNVAAGTNLVFVTDEIVIPSRDGDGRLDLFAIHEVDGQLHPVVIELKSERAMKELLRQTRDYAEFLERHVVSLSALTEAVLGRSAKLCAPAEKWIVWPATDQPQDPRAADLGAAGIRVIGYRKVQGGFEFVSA